MTSSGAPWGDLSFEAPQRLWVLLGLGLLALVAATLVVRRRRAGQAYADRALLASAAPARARWRRPVAALGLALATVALTAAFARPQVVMDETTRKAVVVVALDTSTSMLVDDVAPDRITVAKATAKTFIRELPDDVDVALVAYSATIRLVSAVSSDHEAVAAAVDGLQLTGGTAMGDAIDVSLRAALAGVQADDGDERPAARIVLLSDGGNTTGSPLSEAVTAASDAGVPVSTIAFGSESGIGTVEGGRQVQAPVDYATLEQIAEDTGGTAYRAAGADELSSVYDDIGRQLVVTTQREDVSDLFAGAGLALLMGTAVPSLVWFSRLA